MSEEAYALEEYKFAKEKIRKNEERRYTLLALNITAFAAIFGLSDKLDPLVLPIAVISVLMICSAAYATQSLIQRLTTAFIIERYEKKIATISYETYVHYFGDAAYNSPKSNTIFRILMFVKRLLSEPFLLLAILGLLGSAIISYKAMSILFGKSTLLACIYLLMIITGYAAVLINIFRMKKRSLEYYCYSCRDHFERHNNPIKLT